MSRAVKLATPPIVGLAASAALALLLHTQLPTNQYLKHVSSCNVPARKQLPTDITYGRIPQLDNAFCAIEPLYRGIPINRMNLGAASLVLSILIPTLLRQGYLASSPNNRSFFLGPVFVALLHILGQAIGHGFAFASVGTVILAVGYHHHLRNSNPTVPLVPTPAGSVYWVNLTVLLVTVSALAQSLLSVDGDRWRLANLVYLSYPLWLPVMLLLATAGVKAPKDERAARKELLEYTAEQVSYSYERTWSYHRKAALASMAFYWFGMHRFITSIIYQRSFPPQLTAHAQFLLCDFALLSLYTLLTISLERLTIRTLSSPTHPLTGKPVPKLLLDCQAAIALAPAGNPSLERGSWQPLVAALVAGPGLAASLWWSGGEEEAGWLARRAWREASAVQGEKKQ